MLISAIQGAKFNNNYLLCSNKQQRYNNYNKNTIDTFAFTGKIPVNVFDKYKPLIRHFNKYEIPVHNRDIAKRLKQEYSAKTFKNLFAFAEKNGTFDLDIDPKTHYITTSLIDPKENPLMSKLVWVTDSCNYMPILKDKYPEAAVPLMENISKFYKRQERNFNMIINDPLKYELNHDWPNTAKYGVGHVFNPKNMTTHKWFAHTRLESLGLYLQTMGDLISDGLKGAKYGYNNAKQISQNTIDSIANITAYLKKIIYPYAKSTGPWEEKTFIITPSSDVAIINDGFRKIIDLMYSPTENKELLQVRKRLLESKNGSIFKDEKGLKDILKIGEHRIKTDSINEVPPHNERILDGALSFIPHYELFNDNPVYNAREILKRMEFLEKGNSKTPEIVRSNGTIRYVGDRYLNMTSGHKVDYTSELPPKTEAQWFMTNGIAKSYGMAAKKLLDKIESDNTINRRSIELLRKIISKETEYINRGYARITGENGFKANGKPCPEFQIPEAYQAVTTSKGDIIFVPGSHTPLGWAQASLYDASKVFLENLQRIEKLNINL